MVNKMKEDNLKEAVELEKLEQDNQEVEQDNQEVD